MASGKKGKKTRGKTVALTEFLQETSGSIAIQPIRKSNLNWADEVEDFDDRKPVNVVLPTAPKASRDYDDISDKVPTEPPFCAYLSNLPYDVDEEEIADFFRDMKIASMRIPKDDRSGEAKSKGYGYIEFEDRESLLEALVMRDTTLKSRRIRIEVASNMDSDRRRGGRMDMNRDRPERPETFGDWRSGPRTETTNEDRDGGRRGGSGGGFGRDRDREGSGGFTREGMRDRDENRTFNREGMRERDHARDRDGPRDFGRDRDNNRDSHWRDDDRVGGWRDGDRANKDGDRDRGYNRDRGNFRDSDRSNFSRDSDRGNFRDSDRGGRFDDRDKDDRRGGGFGGRRFEDKERREGFSRSGGSRDDRDSEPPPSEGRERPRLMLAPRTKPVENVPVNTDSVVPSASIFGNAKPVDTSQREREIEAKLAKEHDKPPRDGSKERERGSEEKEKPEEDDKKNIERSEKSRPHKKIEDSPPKDRDVKEAAPRKNYDDKKLPPKGEQKSPDKSDNRHKNEKSEKPKRDERRDRHEKDMPKLAEPEPPNFAANNKFAFLPTDDDNSD